jgi:hypothetical protein
MLQFGAPLGNHMQEAILARKSKRAILACCQLLLYPVVAAGLARLADGLSKSAKSPDEPTIGCVRV